MRVILFLLLSILCAEAPIIIVRGPIRTGAPTPGSGGGGGGITQDGTFTAATGADPSFSHSQGSLTSGYVLVICGSTFSGATSATSVTYDGNAMTEIATFSQASFYHIKIFARDLGTSGSGSKNVVVTHTEAVTSALSTCITFSGVKQGGGFTVVQEGGFEDPQTFNITTTSTSELVIGAVTVNKTVANITPNGTQINEDSVELYNNQKTAGTGGSVTMSWDLDTAAHGATVGVVLQPQ